MENLKIIHRPGSKKFLIRFGPGKYAYLGYRINNGKMYIETTYTPPEFRGRGIATRLMKEALKYAEENGLKVVPVCSFAVVFFRKYKEYRHLMAEG